MQIMSSKLLKDLYIATLHYKFELFLYKNTISLVQNDLPFVIVGNKWTSKNFNNIDFEHYKILMNYLSAHNC